MDSVSGIPFVVPFVGLGRMAMARSPSALAQPLGSMELSE